MIYKRKMEAERGGGCRVPAAWWCRAGVLLACLTTAMLLLRENTSPNSSTDESALLNHAAAAGVKSLSWAIELRQNCSAEATARAHGLDHRGHIAGLSDFYLWELACGDCSYEGEGRELARLRVEQTLGRDPCVAWFELQRALRRKNHAHFLGEEPGEGARRPRDDVRETDGRERRSVARGEEGPFSDPMYKDQWHLHNHHTKGIDVNVTDVWRVLGVTGRGVTVAVVDDGVEWDNPDLALSYNPRGSWDLNNNDPDPMPNKSKLDNQHGTRCAGEVAAVPNDVCGVGVAYGAKFSGVKVLDGPMTDSLEAATPPPPASRGGCSRRCGVGANRPEVSTRCRCRRPPTSPGRRRGPRLAACSPGGWCCTGPPSAPPASSICAP